LWAEGNKSKKQELKHEHIGWTKGKKINNVSEIESFNANALNRAIS
jgi:hypothetical protein